MRRTIFPLLAALALAAGFSFTVGGSHAAVGGYLTGHSHWDDPNGDYEIQTCYQIIGHAAGEGSEIMHIPFREQNAPNFMDLQLRTDGFRLVRRINNVGTVVQPIYSTTHSFGPGDDVMFDLVAQGDTYTVYELDGTVDHRVRGPKWYEWKDDTYRLGVNISYYTVAKWDGRWDNVFATPLDQHGVGHEIHGLEQDARDVPGSGATFDSTIPAEGSVTGASQAKNGSQATYGLPSGDSYTYTFTVDRAGSGHVDFRAPSSNPDGTGRFFDSSFYRLTLGATPTIQRFVGSTASTVHKAPAGSGGAGTYTVVEDGGTISLYGVDGSKLISFDDGGPRWGVRLRLVFGDQTWSWTGKIGVHAPATTTTSGGSTSTGGTTTTPTPTPTPTSTGTFTVGASGDAYVDASNPAANHGTSTALYVDGSPVKRSLLAFNLAGVGGTVTSATLRVHASSSQTTGYTVHPAGAFDEATVTDATTPTFGAAIGTSGKVTGGTWTTVTLDPATVQAAVGGTLNLGLDTADSTNLHLDSRESANPPQLVVTTG